MSQDEEDMLLDDALMDEKTRRKKKIQEKIRSKPPVVVTMSFTDHNSGKEDREEEAFLDQVIASKAKIKRGKIYNF